MTNPIYTFSRLRQGTEPDLLFGRAAEATTAAAATTTASSVVEPDDTSESNKRTCQKRQEMRPPSKSYSFTGSR